VHLAGRSLLVTTALIALVDGFNPCSMWVLSVLLALTLQTKSRRHVLIVGLVFLTVTSVVYAAFIAGLFTVFRVVAFLGWVQVVVALVALTFGLINVKDYFWWGVGPSLTIAAEDKPGIYRAMRRVRTATGSLPGLVAATVALSAGVSLVEFGCTAGFPVLWTNLLNQQQAGVATFVLLLLLYMLIYQLDELAVFLVAVMTLRASRFEERHGRALKLLGGMLMLALAGVMLVRPALMNDVGSALLVFGAAFLVTVLILVVHRQTAPAATQG
jgi:cytochrome c biogenesis protein CcdA